MSASEGYAILAYSTSCNLGDEIQSIAAAQYLPRIDATYDRDTRSLSRAEPCRLIFNAWTDGQFTAWPPGPEIKPLFVSFHINESATTRGPAYSRLPRVPEFKPIASHLAYFKQHEPIGCRDIHTMNMLLARGINAYFSGCLTLTLESRFARGAEILAVDVAPADIPPEFAGLAVHLTQIAPPRAVHSEKMGFAQQHLDRLARAKLVFTSRLHSALPCLAFGTPVVFIHPDIDSDVRFAPYHGMLHMYRPGQPIHIDFASLQNKALPPGLVPKLRSKVADWVGFVDIERPLEAQIFAGVSIIAACRNRWQHLRQALPSWIAAGPNEIVIVDWGSTPRIELVDVYSAQCCVRLITVSHTDRWILTKAYNLAVRLARHSAILKVDCDTVLSPDFLQHHQLVGPAFYAGDWRAARNENERHTNGILYVQRHHFMEAGLYNELINTYGWDDSAIDDQLVAIGCERRTLNLDKVAHIPHSNAIRTDQPNPLDVEIELNRLIAGENVWAAGSPLSRFQVQKIGSNHYTAKYVYGAELSPSLRSQLLDRARTNRNYSALRPPKAPELVPAEARRPQNRGLTAPKIEPAEAVGAQNRGLKLPAEEIRGLSRGDLSADIIRPKEKVCDTTGGSDIELVPLPTAKRAAIAAPRHSRAEDLMAQYRASCSQRLSQCGPIQSSSDVPGAPEGRPEAIPKKEEEAERVYECCPTGIEIGAEEKIEVVETECDVSVSASWCLYVRVVNGPGNKLRALASAWHLAAMSRRELVVYWCPDEHCGARWDELFAPIEGVRFLEADPGPAPGMAVYDYGISNELVIDADVPADLYIKSGCVLRSRHSSWVAENAFLRDRVMPLELEQICDFAALNDITGCIGVHIRMGQDPAMHPCEDVSHYSDRAKSSITRWRASSHYAVFLKEMRSILEREPEARFFVCSDNDAAIQALRAEFGAAIVYWHRDVFDRSAAQLLTGIRDMWLLSICRYILGSNWSSFSEIAHRLGGRPMLMAGKDFGESEKNPSSNPCPTATEASAAQCARK